MRSTVFMLLAVAAISTGCAAGDRVISSDHRHNGHFGTSPTEADIAGR
jgi:hypothetical protein